MREFLQRPFLANTVGDFLVPALLVLVVALLRTPLSKIIITLTYRLIRRWTPEVEKKDFAALLIRPLGIFLILLVFIASIDHLRFPAVWNLEIHVLRSDVGSLIRALKLCVLTVSFFWVLLRLIDFIALVMTHRANLTPTHSDNQIVLFFRDFLKAVVGLIGLIVVLRFLVGREWTSKMVGALGIGAAALALAAKESIENLIGSFIILLDKPFYMGDYVKVSGTSGTVEKIGLRSTRLRTDDKTYVTVPNKLMVDSIVDNVTQMTQRRIKLSLELDPDTSPDALLDLLSDIRALLTADQHVIDNFTLNLNDISERALKVQVICYTHLTEWSAYSELRERINVGILKSMEARHIVLAHRPVPGG